MERGDTSGCLLLGGAKLPADAKLVPLKINRVQGIVFISFILPAYATQSKDLDVPCFSKAVEGLQHAI